MEGDLGSGGMGLVKLARDTRLGRQVAIKLIKEPATELVARFELEARLMASLEHENIVRVYEYGIAARVPYLVLEFVRGPTVVRRLQTGRPTLVEAVRIAIDILRGIAVAHARGIVHRDLKPGNVFLDTTGRAKVADFGLALQINPEDASGERLTGKGLIMGTPGYMAPETIRGEESTAASDIYAVGVILHELLTGQRLYTGSNAMAVLTAQLKGNPPAPSQTNPIVPPALDELVLRALALDPATRIRGDELAQSLERWLDRGNPQRAARDQHGLPPRPYKLLEPFMPQDVPIFFGRDAEAIELVELVDNPRGRAVFVFGPCGIGKSSLLRAGMVPRLDAARLEPIVLVSGPDPARLIRETIASLALKHRITLPSGDEIRPGLLERKPRLMVELLMLIHGVTGRAPVLVLDQLEELFTQNARDSKRIGTFFDTVARLVEAQSLPVRLVLSYRTEFRGDFFPLEERISRLQLSFQVREMGSDGLLEAIEGPSRLEPYGFRYEPGLAGRIASDIVETTREGGDAALPLLQIICSQLHERVQQKGGGLVDKELYQEAIGGSRGALQRYVEQRLASPGYNRRGAMARQMLKALTAKDEGGVRFSRPRDEDDVLAFPDRDAARQTLERLVADHLVVRDTAAEGRRVVRLASEVICALVETWALEPDDTERASRILAWTARQWREHGKRAEDLLAGGLLQFITQHVDTMKGVDPSETEYVNEAVRRRERRFRGMFVAFGGLIAVLVASTLWVVSHHVTRHATDNAVSILAHDRASLRAILDGERRQLASRAKVLKGEPRFLAALDTDRDTFNDEAREFIDNTDADLVAVANDTLVLFSFCRSGQAIKVAAELPKPSATGSAIVQGRAVYITVTVPLAIHHHDKDDATTRLTLGVQMNEKVQARMGQVGRGALVLVVGDQVSQSTLPALRPGDPVSELLAGSDATPVVLGGRRYLAVSEPIATVAASSVRCVLLRDMEEELGFVSWLSKLVVLLGAAGILLALLVSWRLTRSVSRWV